MHLAYVPFPFSLLKFLVELCPPFILTFHNCFKIILQDASGALPLIIGIAAAVGLGVLVFSQVSYEVFSAIISLNSIFL